MNFCKMCGTPLATPAPLSTAARATNPVVEIAPVPSFTPAVAAQGGALVPAAAVAKSGPVPSPAPTMKSGPAARLTAPFAPTAQAVLVAPVAKPLPVPFVAPVAKAVPVASAVPAAKSVAVASVAPVAKLVPVASVSPVAKLAPLAKSVPVAPVAAVPIAPLEAIPAAAPLMSSAATASAEAANTIVSPSMPLAKLTCSACSKQTPTGFAFCQHCGTRLVAITPVPAEPATPIRLTPKFTAIPSASAEPAAVETDDDAASRTDITVKITRHEPKPVREGGHGAIASTVSPAPVPWGRIIFVGPTGSDGASHFLTGDSFDIGRSDGSLVLGMDPHLAARHARLECAGAVVKLRSLDTTNGVYLRLAEPHDLSSGDQILVGDLLFRFETLEGAEEEPASLVELGVRLLGSRPREAWARLRELSATGVTRDVYHLTRPELVLGQSIGDLLFPDDELLSARHAAFRSAGGKPEVEDLGSHTGTFLRLRGERELKTGDVLRLGLQTLRFERIG